MSDWEGCTTGTIRLPNPNQRSVSRKHIGSSILIHKGTLHGFSPERILALADERDNLDGVSLRQRIALFSVLIELWRSTARRIACVSVQFVQLGIDDFSGLCRCVRTTVSETVEARFCADRVEALLLSFKEMPRLNCFQMITRYPSTIEGISARPENLGLCDARGLISCHCTPSPDGWSLPSVGNGLQAGRPRLPARTEPAGE